MLLRGLRSNRTIAHVRDFNTIIPNADGCCTSRKGAGLDDYSKRQQPPSRLHFLRRLHAYRSGRVKHRN